MHEARLFLAGLLHISVDDLEKALTEEYEKRFIQKRNGGTRTLFVPGELLKRVQRRLLKRLLYRIELPSVFHGFRTSHSVVTNAESHVYSHARYWLKIDLEDAFTNVLGVHFRELFGAFINTLDDFRLWQNIVTARARHRRLRHTDAWRSKISRTSGQRCEYCLAVDSKWETYTKLGISSFASLRQLFRQLSKASPIFNERYHAWLDGGAHDCVQLSLFEGNHPEPGFKDFLADIFEVVSVLTFHDGSLPQGAPTSPYLLNLSIYLSGLIDTLSKLSVEIGKLPMAGDFWSADTGFHFTVYADDFTFSSSRSFNRCPFQANGNQRTVKDMILSTIEVNGWYRVNSRKTRSFNFKKGYPLITGLRVTNRRVGLSKKQIQWLRSFIHHAEQSVNPKDNMRLSGWASYVHMVYGDTPIPNQIKHIINFIDGTH